MKLRARFENNKTYKVATGTVFKEEFNETLDSCVLNITNVEADNKLSLEPYTYVYVYDEESNFEKWFLIDNFIESFVNMDVPYYDYQINCFSETKLLEKIQLPNRTIRHTLNETETNKTIGEMINEFCSLYIPKRKTLSDIVKKINYWNYQYIIDFSNVVKDEKFNVECPEMSFNNPTLREVLNSLMQVVGCLPIVKNYKLSYIDLRAEPKDFIVQKGRIYDLKTSNSSDSYLNSITTLCENVVGDNNIVKNEVIGFRDKDNVFLKHTENLKLTTEQPIERINKLELCCNASTGVVFHLQPFYVGFGLTWDIYLTHNTEGQFYYRTLANCILDKEYTITGYKIEYYKGISKTDHEIYLDENYKYYVTRSLNVKKGTLVSTYEGGSISLRQVGSLVVYSDNFGAIDTSIDYDYCVIYLTMNGKTCVDIGFKEDNVRGGDFRLYGSYVAVDIPFRYSFDISSLVFESGKRKCLRTDLTYAPSTISDMTQYYYTTLEYSYGGNTISGFSQTWSYVAWYGSQTENFISKLWNVCVSLKPLGDNLKVDDFKKCLGIENQYLNQISIRKYYKVYSDKTTSDTEPQTEIYTKTDISKYALIYFNIEYTPFNSLNLVYNKKDKEAPFNITQLDNQESSIPSLLNFSAREQQKANRIGNNVLAIHASQVESLDDVNDLNTKYNDSVIFSREIAYYDTYCEVNYIATKDYTLKNYFTSIATKYRAYEYVDYSQTTTRKENKKFYLCLDDNFINGDDKIILGGWKDKTTTEKAFLNTYYFLNFLLNKENSIDSFDYNIVGTSQDENYDLYKNDLSVVKYANTYVLNYKDFDSVSAGIYISDESYNKDLGGYIQSWYMRNENYNDKHKCIFTDYSYIPTNEYGVEYVLNTLDELTSMYESGVKAPKILNYDLTTNNATSLTIVDDNLNTDYNCTYYKSQDEVMSETIQFEYCSLNDNIKVGNHLVDYKQQLSGDIMIYGYYGDECSNFDDIYSIDANKLIKNFIVLSGTDGRLRLNHKTDTTFTYVIATNGTKAINLLKIDNSIKTLCVNVNDTKTYKVYTKKNNLYLPLMKTSKTEENTIVRQCYEE